MEIIEQSVQFDEKPDGKRILNKLERVGRIAYKSEDKIKDGSAEEFLLRIIDAGHEAVIEHETITFKITTDRGVTHELVRHRMASYLQESTRYCNYGKIGMRFVLPVDFKLTPTDKALLQAIEDHYNMCLEDGRTPQQARYFLPNGLKTEIMVTMNLRELRHFFKLRTAKAAHPQMRDIARKMLILAADAVPVVFDDLVSELCAHCRVSHAHCVGQCKPRS